MFAHDLLQSMLLGAVVGALMLGVLRLLGRGGAPAQRGDRVLYRPRPGVWVLGIFILLMGLWLCGFAAVLTLRGDLENALFVLLFATLPLLLAVLLLLPRVVLDEAGIQHKRALLKPLRISWQELDHYELNGNAIITVLLLRPGTGETIKLSNRIFNTEDLLRRAVARTAVQQRPFQRQSWGRM